MDTIDSISLRTLRILDEVARQGSFSAAGRTLSIPRAAVSRTVAQLEDQIGTRLFRRTTRKMALTEAGETLLVGIGDSLTQMRTALANAKEVSGNISGEITLSVSHAFGRHFLLPIISEFQSVHPEISIEVVFADLIDDLIESNIDLTIRIGPLPVSSVVARKLGELDVVLVSAPSLLAGRKDLTTIEAVGDLPAIGFRIPGSRQIFGWPLSDGGRLERLIPKRSVLTCNSVEAVLDLVLAGRGIAVLPRYLVTRHVARGDLAVLLEDVIDGTAEVHLCFTTHRLEPRRVRVLIDHISRSIVARLKQEHA